MLNQGIPTGGKHSVPLAKILLNSNGEFSHLFKLNISLWKKFIDGCSGIYKESIVEF